MRAAAAGRDRGGAENALRGRTDRRRQRDRRRRCRVARRFARTTGASASARYARPTPQHIEDGARRSQSVGATPGTGSAATRARAHSRIAPRTFSSATARALMAVIVREAGKTLENALGDVREAVDFLRYYATEARRLFCRPVCAAGPDRREQYARAARPRPVRLHIALEFPARDLHGPGRRGARRRQSGARQAGRADADHGLPGGQAAARGRRAARRAAPVAPAAALSARRWSKTRASKASRSPAPTRRPGHIQRALADRRGAIVPFIAETGGINAMIADSSALPEQVVRDAVRSAFDSAGQRCSAARVLVRAG